MLASDPADVSTISIPHRLLLTEAGSPSATISEGQFCTPIPRSPGQICTPNHKERLAKPIRDIAWKAQKRLCRRYRRLARAGKLPTVITAAIARELAGFVWAIANQAQSTAAYHTKEGTPHATPHPTLGKAGGTVAARRILEGTISRYHPTLETRPRTLRDVSPVRR
jgi:hypothetical protein